MTTPDLRGAPAGSVTDGRTVRGDRTRRLVLARAVDVASVDGLDGLSIGRLATELDISKSGLIAHFGTKEGLQLATIRAARAIFATAVVEPALARPPGHDRLWALLEGWLAYSRDRRFPGGCFFARVQHEYASRPGAVRDALAEVEREWYDLIAQLVREAQEAGDLAPATEPAQLAFELGSVLETANLRSLLLGGQDAYDRARAALLTRLDAS